MSIRLVQQVFDSNLEPWARLVMLALANYANDAGECWPKTDSLAKTTGLSEREIKYVLRWASEGGLVEIIEKGRGRGKASRYSLHLEKVHSVHPFSQWKRCTGCTKKVHSVQLKGAQRPLLAGSILMEPSLEPSLEPSAVFTVPDTPEAPLEKQPQPLPSESGTKNPKCTHCTDGIIFVTVAGMRRPRPCPTCRTAKQPTETSKGDTPRKQELASAMGASA